MATDRPMRQWFKVLSSFFVALMLVITAEVAEKLSGGHDQWHHSEADRNWPLTGLTGCMNYCTITACTAITRTARLAYGLIIAQIGLTVAISAVETCAFSLPVRDWIVMCEIPASAFHLGWFQLIAATHNVVNAATCKRQKHNSHRSLIGRSQSWNCQRITFTDKRPLHSMIEIWMRRSPCPGKRRERKACVFSWKLSGGDQFN